MMDVKALMEKQSYTLEDLRQIVTILRSENGCPWDREQDHHSIRKDFLEETYEVLEAIDEEDAVLLQEELGDVLLQVVFHARLEEEQNTFTLEEVITGVCKKLIYRHPHVFGSVQAETSEEVLKNWDALKKKEKSQETYTDTLTSVPKVLPSLMRSEKVLKRASRAGLVCPDIDTAKAGIGQAEEALYAAMESGDQAEIGDKMGDMLFQMVNLSRFFGLDCEKDLTNAIEKFINKFSGFEKATQEHGDLLEQADPNTWNSFWQEAKECRK